MSNGSSGSFPGSGRRYPRFFYPGEPLLTDELRVTVLGSGSPVTRRSQAAAGMLVETGAAGAAQSLGKASAKTAGVSPELMIGAGVIAPSESTARAVETSGRLRVAVDGSTCTVRYSYAPISMAAP